eukprot:423254-Amphidinium_carterae.1
MKQNGVYKRNCKLRPGSYAPLEMATQQVHELDMTTNVVLAWFLEKFACGALLVANDSRFAFGIHLEEGICDNKSITEMKLHSSTVLPFLGEFMVCLGQSSRNYSYDKLAKACGSHFKFR